MHLCVQVQSAGQDIWCPVLSLSLLFPWHRLSHRTWSWASNYQALETPMSVSHIMMAWQDYKMCDHNQLLKWAPGTWIQSLSYLLVNFLQPIFLIFKNKTFSPTFGSTNHWSSPIVYHVSYWTHSEHQNITCLFVYGMNQWVTQAPMYSHMLKSRKWFVEEKTNYLSERAPSCMPGCMTALFL